MRASYWFILTLLAWTLTSCEGSKKAVSSVDQVSLEPGSKEDVQFAHLFYSSLREKLNGNYSQARYFLASALAIAPNHPAASYEMGQLYLHEQKALEAVPYLEVAYRSEPDNKWYAHVLAQAYEFSGDFESASGLYLALLEQFPEDQDYYLYLANAYERLGKKEEAVEAYSAFERKMGVSEKISMRKVSLFEELDLRDSIPSVYIRLIEANPYEPRFYGLLANEYKKSGETDKALAVYEELAARMPDDPLVQLSLYEYYELQGKHAEAIASLEKAFLSTELDVDTKVRLVAGMYEQAIIDEQIKSDAFRLLEALLKTHPDKAQTYAVFGDFLSADDQLKEARKAFYSSVEIDDTKYAVWNQILLIDVDLNDRVAMEKDAEAASELFPSQPLPLYILGYARFLNEDYDAAIRALESGKALVYMNPQLEVQFYSTLGDAYYQKGDNQQAWINYDRALRLNPDNLYVLNNYAYYLSLEEQDLARALEMSTRCVEQDPSNATYLDTRGWVYFKRGNFDEAVADLQLAVDFGGSANAEVLEHLGDALYKKGEHDEAKKRWEQARLIEPSESLDQKIEEGLND